MTKDNAYHIAQSGKNKGQAVSCPALVQCTIMSDSEHLTQMEAKAFNQDFHKRQDTQNLEEFGSSTTLSKWSLAEQPQVVTLQSNVEHNIPIPEKFYHVAVLGNLESIQESGLITQTGERSADLGEKRDRVYLFDSIDSAEAALGSWLGEEFDDEEEFVLLSIDPKGMTQADPSFPEDEESWEWSTDNSIDASIIKVEKMNF